MKKLDWLGQMAYIVDMAKSSSEYSDVLGSSLPGAILLPDWRVEIEPRGESKALVWKVATSPAKPAAREIARDFVSLPRPIQRSIVQRGQELLSRRMRGEYSREKPSIEELFAAFRAVGGEVQAVRQITPDALPPFFGGFGALDDFITLADRTDQHIRAFAAFWGPLGICSHRQPWTHSFGQRSPVSLQPVCSPLGTAGSGGKQGWEPLDKWRDLSRDAKAIVLEAIALKNSRERPQDRLSHLFGRVERWVRNAAVPLASYADLDATASWPCGFGITFLITGVYQILALQLLGVAAGGRELAQCTHCGLPFVLTGHREGVRRFCRSCVDKKIPLRYATRDYRNRLAAQKRPKPEN